MDAQNETYHAGDTSTSGLRFYSVGIIAANKALANVEVEVCPIEQFTMLDGYVNDQVDTKEASGTDSLGGKYSVKADMSNTVTARWARHGDSNRITAPDVRRGELVILYQFANSNTYYWETFGHDKSRRRLETVLFAISGIRDEKIENGPDNMYWVEFSSHKKTITVHTSKGDGEPYIYDIQIDAKNGRIIVKDDIGNSILLHSAEHRIRATNASSSLIDIHKKIIDIYAEDQVNITTKRLTVKTTDTIHDASSSITTKTGKYELKTDSYKENSGSKDVTVGGNYSLSVSGSCGWFAGTGVTWTSSTIKLSAPTIILDGNVFF